MACILVLDDEPLIAEMLGEWLTELGHDGVHLCHRLNDALAFAQSAAVDAAILDLTLGQCDSLPVARLLRQRGVPFAFATGHGDSRLSDQGGGAFVISKPFSFAEIEAAVARLLPGPGGLRQ